MASESPPPDRRVERVMKFTLALWGVVCMLDTFGLGWAVGEGRGFVPALALNLVGALVLTALQFRAVTSPDRSSKFVRVWAAWQGMSIMLPVYLFMLANQLFDDGAPRTELSIVMHRILIVAAAIGIASAGSFLFLLLGRNPPVRAA